MLGALSQPRGIASLRLPAKNAVQAGSQFKYIAELERGGAVYILTNKHNTTLYTGVTSNLTGRLIKHINKVYPGSFSARYNLSKLVYYELYHSIAKAISRENRLRPGQKLKK